ncbi:MAG: dienelactone hydrolase family protein, partial [Pirellulales bacterium]|nr:dienelactone hydrolase family protein [Pirellulales bacterium]
MKWYQLPLLVLILSGSAVRGEIQTRSIEYRDQDVTLAGHLAWDDAVSGKRPGVLVVHEWWGLNNYARTRAEQLAKLGYVAFALDMYGKGKLTEHPQQAGEWASAIR